METRDKSAIEAKRANITTANGTTSLQPALLAPENPRAIWTRRLVIAAFWAVAVFFGLPHWTWTTSIHRSTLPLESMNAWAEGKACQPQYPLHIALHAPHIAPEQSLIMASTLQDTLTRQQSSHLHTFYIDALGSRVANSSGNALTINLLDQTSQAPPQFKLRSWEPVMDVHHRVESSADAAELAALLAPEIAAIFDYESASLWHAIKDTPFAARVNPVTLSPDRVSELDRRTTRTFKYAPTYHITFSLFTPAASPSAWEIDNALKEYISPLLASLSSISEFTIDTQVQLFASFSPSIAGPTFDATKNHWTLQHADLTGFVNAAEWPLSPSIGSGPTINLVLYVPPPDKRPLLIDDGAGSSWIIPQWGAVQIHNSPTKDPGALTLDDLRQDMLIFADQLAALLGVPQSPPSLSLRIASLGRERATSLIASASSTLGALSRLTLKLTSISIPDSVAQSVDETLRRLDQACGDLRDGRFLDALDNARVAEAEVEKAFFEPSMVGQVYFPEEHKVAVYVPLLGPMAVPLVMAGLKELKALRKSKFKAS